MLRNKLALTFFKIKLPTNHSLTNPIFIHLTVFKQMTDDKFKC